MNFTDTNVFTNVFQLVFNVFPAFSLNTNSWIGRYQRFLITVSATRTLKDNVRVADTVIKNLWYLPIQEFVLSENAGFQLARTKILLK